MPTHTNGSDTLITQAFKFYLHCLIKLIIILILALKSPPTISKIVKCKLDYVQQHEESFDRSLLISTHFSCKLDCSSESISILYARLQIGVY